MRGNRNLNISIEAAGESVSFGACIAVTFGVMYKYVISAFVKKLEIVSRHSQLSEYR